MNGFLGQLAAGADELVYPLLALVGFVTVFTAVMVRVLRRRDGHYERMQQLPLDGEKDR
jgi:hypothetical protein